jgi:LysR family hca operon transcriptional activator
MAMAMSLVASTRGLALMPAYANNLLPWSVVSRPLESEAPTIDRHALVIGRGFGHGLCHTFNSLVRELWSRRSARRNGHDYARVLRSPVTRLSARLAA